jgi:hypothetical protein
VLVAWRSRRATAIRLLAPFLFLLLALIINAALEANNASQMRVKDAAAPGVVMGAVPSCHQDLFIGPAKECVDFVFTPTGDRDVDVSGRARDGRHLHDKDTADFAVGSGGSGAGGEGRPIASVPSAQQGLPSEGACTQQGLPFAHGGERPGQQPAGRRCGRCW